MKKIVISCMFVMFLIIAWLMYHNGAFAFFEPIARKSRPNPQIEKSASGSLIQQGFNLAYTYSYRPLGNGQYEYTYDFINKGDDKLCAKSGIFWPTIGNTNITIDVGGGVGATVVSNSPPILGSAHIYMYPKCSQFARGGNTIFLIIPSD